MRPNSVATTAFAAALVALMSGYAYAADTSMSNASPSGTTAAQPQSSAQSAQPGSNATAGPEEENREPTQAETEDDGYGPGMMGGYGGMMGGYGPGTMRGYNQGYGPGMAGGGYGRGMRGGYGPGMMNGYGPGMMGYGPGMMGGYGPGMMGYGPGMMGGYGPGMMGYGPGMMAGGYGPPMMGGYGPGMMHGWGPWMMGRGMVPGAGVGCGHWGAYQPGYRRAALNLSTQDVKNRLEQWLAWRGNPHLKVGEVKEKGPNTITADIVTQDNSLVQRYDINRHTGMFRRAED